nr:MAG TPA: LPLAT protein [Caudoviricetes sp.]
MRTVIIITNHPSNYLWIALHKPPMVKEGQTYPT